MPIKGIGQGSPYEQIRIQQEQERANAGKEGVNESTGNANDGVTVSESARLRSTAFKTAAQAPETRGDKVARLKALVDGGRYQMDSRDMAARMVEEDLELPA